MKKSIPIVVFGILLLFATVLALHAWREERMAQARKTDADPLVTVSAAKAAWATITPQSTAVGQIRAQQGAALSLQTAGVIRSLQFHSGETVQQGQVLLRLDPGSLPGALEEAQAQAKLATVNAQRATQVYAVHGISTAELDKAKYGAEVANAKVQSLQEALANTVLRAPFSGVLGLRQVELGEYLPAGKTAVRLESPQNLQVDFAVPQNLAPSVQVGEPLRLQSRQEEKGQQFVAQVIAVDNHVDHANRALTVRAQIRHPGFLRPGMFVLVNLPTTSPQRQLTIPQVAVAYHSYGDFVYVLKRQGQNWIAQAAPVQLGPVEGQDVVVRNGLQAGDQVVTAGQVKLHNGVQVRINNAVSLH